MEPNFTTSAIINFAEKLEDASSKFYEELAKRYIKYKDIFVALANGNAKNKIQITRTYQETITDAFEACFSFKGLDLNLFAMEMTLTDGTSYSDALEKAVKLEERASEFYSGVAKLSESLLATISIAFRKGAESHKNRKIRLKSLLDEATS